MNKIDVNIDTVEELTEEINRQGVEVIVEAEVYVDSDGQKYDHYRFKTPLDIRRFVSEPDIELPRLPEYFTTVSLKLNKLTSDDEDDLIMGSSYAELIEPPGITLQGMLRYHGVTLSDAGILYTIEELADDSSEDLDLDLAEFVCITGIDCGGILELIAEFMRRHPDGRFTKETDEIMLEGTCDIYRFNRPIDIAPALRYKDMPELIKLPVLTKTLAVPQDAGDIVLAGFNRVDYPKLTRGLLFGYNVIIDENGCLINNPKKLAVGTIALNEMSYGKMGALTSMAGNSGYQITEINFKCFHPDSTAIAYVFSQDIDVNAFISYHGMTEPLSVKFVTDTLIMEPGQYDSVFALFTPEEFAIIEKELKDKHNVSIDNSGLLRQKPVVVH